MWYAALDMEMFVMTYHHAICWQCPVDENQTSRTVSPKVADAHAVNIDHDQELQRPSTRGNGNIGMIPALFCTSILLMIMYFMLLLHTRVVNSVWSNTSGMSGLSYANQEF